MKNFDDDIKKLWRQTEPALTSWEREEVRRNVWAKIERHKKLVRLEYGFAAAAVIIIAAVIVFNMSPTGQNGTVGDIDYYTLSVDEDELIENLDSASVVQVYSAIAGGEIDSIYNAVIEDSDPDDVFSSLPEDEQEQILLALSEQI